MDINTLRSLSTVLVMITFIGVCWWAFAPRRKKRFEEAANLPFADDADADNSTLRSDSSKDSDEAKAG